MAAQVSPTVPTGASALPQRHSPVPWGDVHGSSDGAWCRMARVLRRLSGGGLFVLIFVLLALVVQRAFPPVAALEIRRAAVDFATQWQAGQLAQVSYDPASAPEMGGGDPQAIADNTTWMVRDISPVDDDRPISVTLVGGPRNLSETTASQALAVTWQLDSGRTWTYQTEVVVANTANRLRVRWFPQTVHPDLRHGLVLRAHRLVAARAPIQDAAGGTFPATTTGPAANLIGTVQPATHELTELDEGRIAPGDQVGISGLQQRYDSQLAGRAGVEVNIVRDGLGYQPLEPVIKQVYVSPPTPGKPVVLTLDPKLQANAEAAVAGQRTPTALVAVDIPSGAVLAVADSRRSPGDVLGLQGQYPPGSAFRLVTMLALNRYAGIGPTDPADCRELRYLGQQFTNGAGAPATRGVPFSTAFAADCITGFGAAAPSLTNAQLREAAAALGFGRPSGLGYPGYDGVIPTTTDLLEHVEDALGEGGVLASPLTMARASATVASGIQRPPSLVSQPVPDLPAATSTLHPAEQALLAQLMKQSVPAQLGGIGNGSVSALCGVAAYGPAADATQHVWCTGFQGSTAFAVLVTKSNGSPAAAATVAASFLNLPR